jgi:hypothetical protein
VRLTRLLGRGWTEPRPGPAGALSRVADLHRLAQEPTRHGGNGHRLFLTFAASSVCASANVRTIAEANAANALGVGAVTDGFVGQTTMTKVGLSAGCCSSMLSLRQHG